MKAVVAGATGLIGSFLVRELAGDADFTEVIALTRREKENTDKVRWQTVDYESDTQLKEAARNADVVFCCLGTTMKKAGSKNAFLKVDYEYVNNLAEAASVNAVRQFSVISAMGADEKSKIFYNHVKGRMEKSLSELNFDQLTIFRPSLLLGPREEDRTGEKIGIFFGKLFAPLLFGSLKKYHPIHAEDIARAMCREAKKSVPGKQVLTYREIVE